MDVSGDLIDHVTLGWNIQATLKHDLIGCFYYWKQFTSCQLVNSSKVNHYTSGIIPLQLHFYCLQCNVAVYIHICPASMTCFKNLYFKRFWRILRELHCMVQRQSPNCHYHENQWACFDCSVSKMDVTEKKLQILKHESFTHVQPVSIKDLLIRYKVGTQD